MKILVMEDADTLKTLVRHLDEISRVEAIKIELLVTPTRAEAEAQLPNVDAVIINIDAQGRDIAHQAINEYCTPTIAISGNGSLAYLSAVESPFFRFIWKPILDLEKLRKAIRMLIQNFSFPSEPEPVNTEAVVDTREPVMA